LDRLLVVDGNRRPDLEEEFDIEISEEWLSVESFEKIHVLYDYIESVVGTNENNK